MGSGGIGGCDEAAEANPKIGRQPRPLAWLSLPNVLPNPLAVTSETFVHAPHNGPLDCQDGAAARVGGDVRVGGTRLLA